MLELLEEKLTLKPERTGSDSYFLSQAVIINNKPIKVSNRYRKFDNILKSKNIFPFLQYLNRIQESEFRTQNIKGIVINDNFLLPPSLEGRGQGEGDSFFY